jgi:hypothetical protein
LEGTAEEQVCPLLAHVRGIILTYLQRFKDMSAASKQAKTKVLSAHISFRTQSTQFTLKQAAT